MTAFKWDGDEYSNYRDRYSILSNSLDLYAFRLVLDSLPIVEDILELGTYIGGSLIFFNKVLKQKNINTRFTAVDHIVWANNYLDFRWLGHARRSLDRKTFKSFQNIKTASEAAQWLQERCKQVSGEDINLRWLLTEDDLDDRKYNVIFHDYGRTKEENIATLDKCLPKLRADGIYVIDDFETAQPYRVFAVVEAMQQEKLFPVLWGTKKAFFTKSVGFAITFTNMIKNNPNFENYIVESYDNYTSAGITYKPLRIKISPLY